MILQNLYHQVHTNYFSYSTDFSTNYRIFCNIRWLHDARDANPLKEVYLGRTRELGYPGDLIIPLIAVNELPHAANK